jgi:Peptidase A4 family
MPIGNASPGTAADRIKTRALPPAGFNPRSAPPDELRRYGLPQRPDASTRPQLAALWDKIFSRELKYIVPSFQPLEQLLPGIKPRSSLRPDLATGTNGWWSGCVVHATPGQMFNWVLGQWNVPDVQPPTTGEGQWYSFAWIGIDGTSNSDLTQIGTIQYASSDAQGNLSKSWYAVYEWIPNSWSGVGNFPVNSGDTVIALICMESTSYAWANMVNVTTGVHVSFPFTAPSSSADSQENQIEWIMEHPGYPGESPQLPNFGEIYFDSAMGGSGLDFLADAGTDTVLNMVENNVTVATTTVETPTLIKIAYTGS